MAMIEELKNKLDDEISRLTHELQVALPKAIQKAVEHGDLRENSEYKSALERQQFVQARLNHLTKRRAELSNIDLAQVPADRVGFGSRVTVEDLRSRDEETYTLVFGDYIDIDTGQISIASPLGQALMGKRVGDEVRLQLPRGERLLKVTELTTLSQMVGAEASCTGRRHDEAPAAGIRPRALALTGRESAARLSRRISSTSVRSVAMSSAMKPNPKRVNPTTSRSTTSVSSGRKPKGGIQCASRRPTVASPMRKPSTIRNSPPPPKNCIGLALNFR